MELFAIIFYGSVNLAMILRYFCRREQYYQYPFWAGVISLGWFFPQAVSLYSKRGGLPEGAFSAGITFAALCSAALWFGYAQTVRNEQFKPNWLDAEFLISKLYYVGVFFCIFGFFFQWKLMSLPKEVLASTMWSGAAVKYLFLASVFRFGFITLWILYLSQRKWLAPKMLIFIVPSMLLMLNGVILHGRRAEMMDLFAIIFIGMWFARRIILPRWMMFAGLVLGLVLINAIGVYRSIMEEGDAGLKEKLTMAVNADYIAEAEKETLEANVEIQNYLFFRQVYEEEALYDYGIVHWNLLVFNYVPGQIVGRALKDALMQPLKDCGAITRKKYGHVPTTGSTVTGYLDSFGSFGWFGFVKFMLVGHIMGVLYRHAMRGAFLGQLLYIFALSTSMHAVTHQTNDVLVRIWVYFFALAYPAFYLAKVKKGDVVQDAADA